MKMSIYISKNKLSSNSAGFTLQLFCRNSVPNFGLNFPDAILALGQLDTNVMSFKYVVIVTRVGYSVLSCLKVGDRVCVLLRGY